MRFYLLVLASIFCGLRGANPDNGKPVESLEDLKKQVMEKGFLTEDLIDSIRSAAGNVKGGLVLAQLRADLTKAAAEAKKHAIPRERSENSMAAKDIYMQAATAGNTGDFVWKQDARTVDSHKVKDREMTALDKQRKAAYDVREAETQFVRGRGSSAAVASPAKAAVNVHPPSPSSVSDMSEGSRSVLALEVFNILISEKGADCKIAPSGPESCNTLLASKDTWNDKQAAALAVLIQGAVGGDALTKEAVAELVAAMLSSEQGDESARAAELVVGTEWSKARLNMLLTAAGVSESFKETVGIASRWLGA